MLHQRVALAVFSCEEGGKRQNVINSLTSDYSRRYRGFFLGNLILKFRSTGMEIATIYRVGQGELSLRGALLLKIGYYAESEKLVC